MKKRLGGLRLYHPTARLSTATIAIGGLPYPVPYLCPLCALAHTVKTVHVRVDANGFAFVSHEVWRMLTERGARAGFQLANDVTDPPSQIVGHNGHSPVQVTVDDRGGVLTVHHAGTPVVAVTE